MAERSPSVGTAIDFGGERLELLPERGAWLPDYRALLIADVHFGKETIFRRHGVPVPDGPSYGDLDRLIMLCRTLGVEALWILGDLVHGALSSGARENLRRWLRELGDVQVHLVQGNHDRHDAAGLKSLAITRHQYGRVGALRLAHAAEVVSADEPTVCGHIHPVATITVARHRPVRAPAFACTANTLTLPAFGEFTGGHRLLPSIGLQRYAVLGGEVVQLPNR